MSLRQAVVPTWSKTSTIVLVPRTSPCEVLGWLSSWSASTDCNELLRGGGALSPEVSHSTWPDQVRVRKNCSSALSFRTGTPHGCVLRPMLLCEWHNCSKYYVGLLKNIQFKVPVTNNNQDWFIHNQSDIFFLSVSSTSSTSCCVTVNCNVILTVICSLNFVLLRIPHHMFMNSPGQKWVCWWVALFGWRHWWMICCFLSFGA